MKGGVGKAYCNPFILFIFFLYSLSLSLTLTSLEENARGHLSPLLDAF